MKADDMGRGQLVGVRLKPSEVALLKRVRAKLEAPHGVPVSDQTVMRMGLERLARELGVDADADVPAPEPSRPRAKTKRA